MFRGSCWNFLRLLLVARSLGLQAMKNPWHLFTGSLMHHHLLSSGGDCPTPWGSRCVSPYRLVGTQDMNQGPFQEENSIPTIIFPGAMLVFLGRNEKSSGGLLPFRKANNP